MNAYRYINMYMLYTHNTKPITSLYMGTEYSASSQRKILVAKGIYESSSDLSNRKHTKTLLTHNEYRHNIIRSANQAKNSRSKWKTIKMVPIIHAEKLISDSTHIARIVMT